jgi:hypothetical protein
VERRGGRHADRDQALSVVGWSAVSGLVLGLFADALLVGLWVILAAAVPAVAQKTSGRTFQVLAVAILTMIPTLATILGVLEGRLKLR